MFLHVIDSFPNGCTAPCSRPMIFPPEIRVNRDARPVCTPELRNQFHCLGQQPRQGRPTHILAAANRPPATIHYPLPMDGRAVPALPCAGGHPPQRPPVAMPPCWRVPSRCVSDQEAMPPCVRNSSWSVMPARTTPPCVRGSRSSIHDSRFTTHDSRFTTHDSRFTIHDSRFTIHDSRLTTHDSRLTPATSSAACAAAGTRAPNAAKRLSSVWPRTYRT